ncbi:methyl-accepting chemotaxis protein [Aquitalea palustris]|uniref:Methyl-accepting chemotaxis protein n=1 Tax=Aquitalea palustris TaxID=2480983 RepID=A0A454JEI0_9NEIS|nr:methyl-accepting chemotaxis protein [Aquitalea palustris]RMC93365.1 methyl-accepting chemotaxis protein [Aquitalea palustris]
MNNLKVSHRLLLGFGLLVVVIIAAMAVAIAQIHSLRNDIDEIANTHVPRAAEANKVVDNVNVTARATRTLLLSKDPVVLEQQQKQLDESLTLITRQMSSLSSGVPAEGQVLFDRLRTVEASYRQQLAVFRQHLVAGQEEEAKSYLLQTLRATQLDYLKAIDDYIKFEEGLSRQVAQGTLERANSAAVLLNSLMVAAVLIAMLAGWLISRSLLRQIGGEPAAAVKLMQELAAGEVTTELKVAANDNSSLFAYIRQAADKAVENIRVRNALDNAATNMMIADAAFNVVYANQSVINMFSQAESDIRRDLPQFSARNLLGSNIDQFHRNPAHQRGLMQQLRNPHQGTIHVGGRTFQLILTPINGRTGERLGYGVEWIDRTADLAQQAIEQQRIDAERAVAAENARIRSALDNVTTNVMIADNERNIIYVNHSVLEMLAAAEADLRKALPNFSTRHVLGGSMDMFHRNPAHQRDLLANLRSTYKADIAVGGRHFSLTANPVFGGEGERLGTVVEWKDRTGEVLIEKEVEAIVNAAGKGDYASRLVVEGKTGFFRVLSEGVNQLLSVTSQALGDIAIVLGGLAQGDLTRTIKNDYEGMLGQLKSDTNATVERLRSIVGNIQESTEAINTASQEIAAGNSNLSGRTEQQAASLEETASSMEEITSTVRQNAENAKKANSLAIGASDIAARGGQVVGNVVSTMNEINDSAKKIVDIISVIDGIAFQTNILALNAAVEAARAGEQGRGFAVVASEVRNLAQRSAAAAKEIKLLIGNSVDKVESGSRLVDEAGRTMEEIVSSIRRVADIMSDISAASIEQSSGIEQVNLAVTQMDENTQKNAALVEQAAAAAESLEEQARHLMEAVSIFRLDGTPVARLSAPKAQRSHDHGQPARLQAPGQQVKPVSARMALNAERIKTLPGPAQHDDEWEEF